MNWQFVDATERVAFRVNPDGSIESVLASALPPDVAPLPAPVPALADYQKAARARIDSDVDAVYYAVIGDRTTEYQAANDDAKAFKNAGYVGTAPASVQCWATVKGWTAQQACRRHPRHCGQLAQRAAVHAGQPPAEKAGRDRCDHERGSRHGAVRVVHVYRGHALATGGVMSEVLRRLIQSWIG
jgi:hypothetical protein